MNVNTIETASLRAWPAFEQFEEDGWISRFTDGYTKRANSVTVLQPNPNSLEGQVARYEELYNTRGLPCVFRLLSTNDNQELEKILNSRGYSNGDHSLVLAQNLENRVFSPLEFDSISIEEWMTHYCLLNNKDLEKHATHSKMINNIEDRYLLALLKKNTEVVACGLGVITDGLFGLFDLVTHSQFRKKGYGFELVSGMLSWAVQNNAETAYVQVVADNTPAVSLYHKLGFTLSYEYHYKIQNVTQ